MEFQVYKVNQCCDIVVIICLCDYTSSDYVSQAQQAVNQFTDDETLVNGVVSHCIEVVARAQVEKC